MAFATKWWIGRALALTLALPGCPLCSAGTQPIPQTNPDTLAALHDMTRLAGVIFAGCVISLRRRAGVAGAAGTVEIEFAVENAIRGVAGSSYTLREWAGLWAAGDEPFRVGQRYLVLLHAPGASGSSSPIGGADGAIPIHGEAGPLADSRAVDLRWIAAQVARTIAYRMTLRPTSLLVALHPYAETMAAGRLEESGSVDTLPQTRAHRMRP
jgi:hypothetical protein